MSIPNTVAYNNPSLSSPQPLLETAPTRRRSDVEGVFFFHATADSSEIIDRCANLEEVKAKRCEQGCPFQHRQQQQQQRGEGEEEKKVRSACQPFCLCGKGLDIGQSLSLMASYAEFTIFTRAHLFDPISAAAASGVWERACSLTLYHFSTVPPQYAYGNRGFPDIVGVVLERQDVDRYHIYVVIQCPVFDPSYPTSQAITVMLRAYEFFLGLPVAQRFLTLPICDGLRHVKLSVWWTPKNERIFPNDVLPVLRVILTKPLASSAYEAARGRSQMKKGCADDPLVFDGYSAVHIFLARPFHSTLGGTVRVDIPHRPKSEILEEVGVVEDADPRPRRPRRSYPHQHPLLAAAEGEPLPSPPAAAKSATGRESGEAVGLSSSSATPSDTSSQQPQAAHVFRFSISENGQSIKSEVLMNYMWVRESGEHVFAVEVEVEEAYRPFLPTLTAEIVPFLVVPH